MNVRIAMLALCAALVGCAPAPPPPPAAAAPAPTPAPREHRVVALATVPCRELLAVNQEDRALAAMFYLGYASGRLHRRTIDVGDVEGLETAALDECARLPDQPASAAFMRVLEEMRGSNR